MKRQWDEDELAALWTLGPAELALLGSKASLDVVELGFGAGYQRQEHDRVGVRYDAPLCGLAFSRKARTR